MHIQHQPQNSDTFSWAEIALFLPELVDNFPISSDQLPFKQTVSFPRGLEDVANPMGHVAIQDPPLVSGWEAVGNRQQDTLLIELLYPLGQLFTRFSPGDEVQMPRHRALAIGMGPLAQVDVIRWL